MHFWAPKETEQKNPTQIGNKKPNKPAVVLAHTFAGDGIIMWFFQVLALASQYSVYVPDFLFLGGSTTSRPDRSPGFQAECLARGLRKLGVEKCTVVGLSYGGIVGFKTAAMYPELIEALVVSSTVIELKQSISSESLTKIGVSRWSELLLPESVEGVKTLFTVGSHKWPWLPDFVYKDSLEREMVNMVAALLKPLIHGLVKLAGLTPQTVEIEPGTVMHFWAPIQTGNKKPNKPAVVLAHPFACDGILMWFFQVLALTSQYSVYVPDFLFFGGSTTSRLDRSTDFQAECLARGLRKLGVEKCTVVGLSYGGMVGFKMAAMYPELVEALVASSTVIEMTESISNRSQKNIGITQWSELLLPETVEGVKFLFTVCSHKWPWMPDFLYKHSLEELFGNRKQKAELLEALVVTDQDSTNVTKYPQRVHFLWGHHDKIFTSDLVHSMKEQLGEKATIQWIKDAGHIPHIERPFAYNNHLKEILASIYDSP